MNCRECKTEPVWKFGLCHNCYSYRHNQDCEMRDSRFCEVCHYRFACLDGNKNHRYERSKALDTISPGESVTVEGIEYMKPKRACVNCGYLDFRVGEPYCHANAQRMSMDDLVIDQSDCWFWSFRE